MRSKIDYHTTRHTDRLIENRRYFELLLIEECRVCGTHDCELIKSVEFLNSVISCKSVDKICNYMTNRKLQFGNIGSWKLFNIFFWSCCTLLSLLAENARANKLLAIQFMVLNGLMKQASSAPSENFIIIYLLIRYYLLIAISSHSTVDSCMHLRCDKSE